MNDVVNLVRGQRLPLGNPSTVEIRFRVIGPAPMYGIAAAVTDQDLTTGVGACEWMATQCPFVVVRPGSFSIEIAQVPLNAKVRCAVAVADEDPGFWAISSATVEVLSDGELVGTWAMQGSDFHGERTVNLVDVYRRDATWRLNVIGAGYATGRRSAAERFNVAPSTGAAAPRAGTPSPSSVTPRPQERSLSMSVPNDWPGGVRPNLPGGLAGAVALLLVVGDSSSGTGTGFFISPGGLLVTAEHVITDASSVLVVADGTSEARQAEVLAASPRHDLAVLRCTDGAGSRSWLPLERGPRSQLGAELGMLGYPLGTALGDSVTYNQGIVSGIRSDGEGDDRVPYLQYDLLGAPGSSGAPVFSRETGRVVAVHHGAFSMEGLGAVARFGVCVENLFDLGWLV